MQTINKVYDSYEQARTAVNELESAGIPSASISVIANKQVSAKYVDHDDDTSNTAAGAGAGAVLGGGAGLLAGLGVLAIPGIGPIVAAGWLAAAAAGAVAGGAAGGMVGALVDAGVSESDAHVYSEAIRRGRTLVSVRAEGEQAERARSILDRHAPLDADRLATDYRNTGWKRFDPNAGPYEMSEVELERSRRL